MGQARIGFLEIPAREPERLATFLSSVFGWSATARDWAEGPYMSLDGGAGEVGCGLVGSPPSGITAPTPVVHLELSAVGACLERVLAAGGEIVELPRPVEDFGVFARFADSEGNIWGLWAVEPGAGQDEG